MTRNLLDVVGDWLSIAGARLSSYTRQRNVPRRTRRLAIGVEKLEAKLPFAADLFHSRAPLAHTPAPAADHANHFAALSTFTPELNAGGQGGSSKPTTNSYAYSVVGNAADVARNATSSGLGLVGGATDVDEVFRWMGAKANGGDFLVIRATGTGAYNSYIDQLVPSLDSVATLVISTLAGANNDTVAQLIRSAEAIFIAGGDQADYINLWKNTKVESSIYEALARGAPIGGTSAGLAVLSDFDFSAQLGTITSAEALANPYDSRIILDSGFISDGDYAAANSGQHSVLKYLDYFVTDSHFQQRDRMGRLLTFMARMDQDGLAAEPRGIGINEQTALLIEANGMARVVGNPYSKKLAEADQARAVYFVSTTTATTQQVVAGQPLVYTDISVVKADYNPKTGSGDTFDLVSWVGVGVTNYSLFVFDVDHDGDSDIVSNQIGGRIY